MDRESPLTARNRRRLLQRSTRTAATLLAVACAWQQLAHAADEPATASRPPREIQAADSADAPSPATELTENSTLSQWKAASAPERSQLAVAMARARLPSEATKLELATAAMEISGCLTTTARDPRFDAWTLAPTATTCLTAPERPAKE